MQHARRSAFLLLFLLFLVPLSAQQPKQARSPKLVLVVVVDQFRYDYLTRFRADYRGGIERLLERGAVFADARYVQYPTVTAIGHSTVLSGATPSVSGIIGNEWFDREAKESVTSVSDRSVTLLGGAPGGKASSPHRLLVSTLGDELKMAGRKSKVIGISIKDRSAILPVGHMADAAYWLDAASNHFVSSSYYMKALPAWVAAVNQAEPVKRYAGQTWTAIDAKPGDKPFCSMTNGTPVRFCGEIEKTWFGNELLEEFAEKAIDNEKLGQHGDTDLLALSFSANDYIGHELGPDSPEVRDISLRTDRLLAKLFDFINARLGEGTVLVVFTADHGVAPVPAVNNSRKMPGGWLDAKDYSRKITSALSSKFGGGEWLLKDGYGFLYLNYETAAANKADIAEVRRFAADFARTLPHIARVLTRDDLLHGGAAADSFGRALELGFYATRSADIFLLPEPYYMFVQPPETTHQTPYSYDNHVPLIFFGAGISAGMHYEPVTINDIAPTLAAILQVETPSGSSGRILAEILR